MASAGRQRRCADNGGQRKVTKRQAIVAQLVSRSATADFRAIKILLDTCGTSRARPTRHLPRLRLSEADEKVIEQIKARFFDRETRAMKVLTRGLSPGPGIRLRRFVPDSPLEEDGFELWSHVRARVSLRRMGRK